MIFNAQRSLVNETYEKFLDLLGEDPDPEKLYKCIDSCKQQLSDSELISELNSFWESFKDVL